jgi:TolB protein
MRAYPKYLLVLFIMAFFATTLAQDDADIPGKIAFIGTDYNVYVWDGLGNDPVQLTDDADRDRTTIRRYQMPTWSTDGRLAYFSTEIDTDSYTTSVYVSEDGAAIGNEIYIGEDEVLNYAAWSPQNCDMAETCRELAMLVNNRTTGGLFIRMVEDQVGGFPNEIIGRGGPFYFSWSSNGENMLWQRNNRRLDIYSVNERALIEELDYRPGIFQTPHWSPVDDRLLVGTLNSNETSTDLSIISGEIAETLVEGLEGVVYFSWSPSGNYVAYTSRNDTLTVLDSRTGDVVTETIVSGIGPFFWSPDSSKIAFVTLATPEGTFTTKAGGIARPALQAEVPELAWSVVDVDTGEVRRYSAFVPTTEMVYVFTYFDQFAKSHSFWSPDSQYLVYSEITDDMNPIISIIDTDIQDTFPLSIAEGYLGIWSYN